jgi:hypothetical protein
LLLATWESVVRVLPTTAGAYALLGWNATPAVGEGLEFRDVASHRRWAGAEEVLIVAGAVLNIADTALHLPDVRVALYDFNESEVQSVIGAPDRERIAPGEVARFEVQVANPALTAKRIRVSFEAEDGGDAGRQRAP